MDALSCIPSKSIVSFLFGSLKKTHRTCQNINGDQNSPCGYVSTTYAYFNILDIEFPADGSNDPCSLDDCLRRYFSSEDVSMTCDRCKTQSHFKQTQSWHRLPKVLIIKIGRNVWTPNVVQASADAKESVDAKESKKGAMKSKETFDQAASDQGTCLLNSMF
jgi:ubiquitin C-terminal hydrolase